MIRNIKSSKMLKKGLIVSLILSLSIFALAGCSSGGSTKQPANSGTNTSSSQAAVTDNAGKSVSDTDGDGIPDSVEKTYGTNPYVADTDGDGVDDKSDQNPLSSENLIKETSNAPLALKIKDVRVEDNATSDHLEITMTNIGKTDLSGFDVYYTITDKVDKTQESYYQVLSSLTLNAGETKTIHFDNQVAESGHYYGNMNGLYGTSKNGLAFDIQLHAKGFQLMQFQVDKAKGTAEVSD